MKQLFENDIYTTDSRTLSQQTRKILEPLFGEYIERGYSPREISHIIILSVMDVENEIVLTKMFNKVVK